jgi:ribonuclease R
MRSLPGDYYDHDEAHHRLVGRRTRRIFTLGDPVTAKLAEANTVTGSLLFALDDDESRPLRARPEFGRHRRRR